jgi:hypothetical protein
MRLKLGTKDVLPNESDRRVPVGGASSGQFRITMPVLRCHANFALPRQRLQQVVTTTVGRLAGCAVPARCQRCVF